ncbi:MAG: integrase arm-type DNA-binding domain-containing protein, partial [Alphaproteobacteria bacterium]|nr:integrase arm-type DNA-binding domain-containing protein [Alphaproteobacteria bacterium]
MAQRITDVFCRTVEPPKNGQKIYFDESVRGGPEKIKGFGLRVSPRSEKSKNGRRSFILEYWLGGRQRRYTIGKYPEWKPEAARKRAAELRRQIDRGDDPMDARIKLRTDPTVKKLADRYYEEHLPTKAPQSQIDDRAMIEDEILPRLGKRKVAEIHYNDIRALHRSITDRGAPVRANRVLSVLSKMFSLSLIPRAGEVEPWRTPLQGNPCKGVARNTESGRQRFFSAAEIERIAEALGRFPGRGVANVIRLVMLTGCRPGEAMRATWDQFDLDAGVWTKPASSTKTRKVHRVPLAAAATQLLQNIREEIDEDCPFVFP